MSGNKQGEVIASAGADQAYYQGVIPYLITGGSNKDGVSEAVSDADLYRVETPVMFDRTNREHVLALKEIADYLLRQIDHGGEPVQFLVGPNLVGDRELRLATIDEVSAGMGTVKLDFLIPL